MIKNIIFYFTRTVNFLIIDKIFVKIRKIMLCFLEVDYSIDENKYKMLLDHI